MDLTQVAPAVASNLGSEPVSSLAVPTEGSLQVQPLDTQSGDRVQADAEAQRLKPADPGAVVGAAWRGESVTNSIIDRFHGPEFRPDPDFRLDPEWVKQEAKTRGIPNDYLPALKDATSQAHAESMLDGISAEMKDRQTIADAGWGGVAASMGAAVLDPVSLVANIATGGAGGTFAKGARLARIFKGGLAAAGANMSIEAYLNSQQYTRDPHDIAMAGFMGFVLGGAAGGLTSGENAAFKTIAQNGYTDMQLSRLKADGMLLTPEGEARLAAARVPGEGEGFLAGSIGSGQIAPVEGVETAYTHVKVPFTNWKIPIRFDYYAKFAVSDNPVVKQIGDMLLADGVGKKGNYAATMNASEFAAMHQQIYRGQFYSEAGDAFSSYADRMGYNWWQRKMVSEQASDFFKDVTAHVRGDASIAGGNPEAARLGEKLVSLHGDILSKLKEFGVAGAEDIVPNPQYMMRRFNYDGINKLRKEHTPARVNDLISGAIQSARADINPEKADRIAKAYMSKVSRMQYDHDFNRAFMTSADKDALANSLKGNLAPDEHEALMGLLDVLPDTPKVEGAASPRLKPRTKMDENFSKTYTGADGSEKTMKVSDLFENDSRNLFDIYSRQTTGLMGLAKVGIKSPEDWAALRKQVVDHAEENFANRDEVTKTLSQLDDVHNYIRGVPMSNQPFGKMERMARVLRDVNFMRMMGQSGAAQLVDATNLVGLAGWRAFSTMMPSVGEVLRLAKAGMLDDTLARDLANIGGFGTETLAHNPIWQDISEMTPSATLSKVERTAKVGAHAVSYASGLQSINNIEKTIASRVFAQKFVDMALGVTEVTPELRNRLATSGLAGHELDAVLERMKMHSEVEGPTGKVSHIDYETWQKQSPESYQNFQMGMFREVRRAIQESTIGETAPWMHSTLGKVLTQFRSFSLVAWNKQFLYGFNHMSPAIVAAWGMSTVMGGLQYVALTHLNFLNDPAERDKRLTATNIAAAGFNKAGYSSIIPGVFDTVAGATTGRQLFKSGRTSGLDTGAITGNPTFDLVYNKLGNTISSAAQSALTNDYVWTQKDAKNMLGIFPNLYGYRNFTHAMTSDLPKVNFLRQGQQ